MMPILSRPVTLCLLRGAIALTSGCVVLLAGCASYPGAIAPGMTHDELIARFGAPASERHRGDDWTVVYTTEPAGQQAFQAQLDVSGRVVSVVQVLDSWAFAKVVPQQWTHEDVLAAFGPPTEKRRLSGMECWDYHYKQDASFDASMSIFFDDAGRVVRLENGPDFSRDRPIK
jgi:hypothetical protein